MSRISSFRFHRKRFALLVALAGLAHALAPHPGRRARDFLQPFWIASAA